jgi:hypothetical protein
VTYSSESPSKVSGHYQLSATDNNSTTECTPLWIEVEKFVILYISRSVIRGGRISRKVAGSIPDVIWIFN